MNDININNKQSKYTNIKINQKSNHNITINRTYVKKIVLTLDQLLLEREISSYKVNKDTRITMGTIKKFRESNIYQIDIKVLETLLNYLDCDLSDLFHVVEVENKS